MAPNPNDKANQQQPEITRSPSFVKIYSNSASIETSIWDCRLTFGDLVKTAEKTTIEQSVSVVMSVQHLKALTGILASNLHEYESRFGEIRLQPKEQPLEPTKTPSVKGKDV